MSSLGRAEDTYRVGTKDAGPVCEFTGLGCPCGADCRRCNVPQGSILARILEALSADRVEQLHELLDSTEARAGEPQVHHPKVEQEMI